MVVSQKLPVIPVSPGTQTHESPLSCSFPEQRSQPSLLGSPAGRKRGTRPHEWQVGVHAQLNLCKLSCACMCAWVHASLPLTQVKLQSVRAGLLLALVDLHMSAHWSTAHIAQFRIGQGPVVGHSPGIGDLRLTENQPCEACVGHLMSFLIWRGSEEPVYSLGFLFFAKVVSSAFKEMSSVCYASAWS